MSDSTELAEVSSILKAGDYCGLARHDCAVRNVLSEHWYDASCTGPRLFDRPRRNCDGSAKPCSRRSSGVGFPPAQECALPARHQHNQQAPLSYFDENAKPQLGPFT